LVAFGDPDAAVGFGYVTNLRSFRIGERERRTWPPPRALLGLPRQPRTVL
jgi:hypothetical protein